MQWTPTRAAGLARLTAFVPHAGKAYTRNRNSDLGPTDRSNVSALSPYLARRMITESEVIDAVLSAHGFLAAEKFIQEVFWRTYWKGWLELRPSVLVAFNQERLAVRAQLADDTRLCARVIAAQQGQTGITCFDAWVGELKELGWLHNHTRMWFASIWIFTLELPWQLGADFFYKHLLDADAASNTCSWRWVAGLHTKGKHYLARASNIASNTNGRFNPVGQLNETAKPLQEVFQIPGPARLRDENPLLADKVGLLITQEDLHPKSLDIPAQVIGAATFSLAPIGDANSPRNQFSAGAMVDASARIVEDFGVEVVQTDTHEGVVNWAQSIGVTHVVTAYAPTGLIAWRLQELRTILEQHDIALVQIRRDWDSNAWLYATGGFFKLKEKLPSLLRPVLG